MDIASAQQIGSASPDIRTGIYRGRSVTYEIIDGLAVWDGDIILGTPEELEPSGAFAAPGKALDIPGKALLAVSNKKRLWPGGIIPYVIDPLPRFQWCRWTREMEAGRRSWTLLISPMGLVLNPSWCS